MSDPFTTDNPPFINENIPEAVIAVGNITATDSLAKYAELGQGVDIITDYQIRNSYEEDGHVYMAGLSSPTPFQGKSVAFFRLYNKTLLWVARWTGCKFNASPQIPDPLAVPAGWLLLHAEPETAEITVGPDGATPLYRISGVYVYGHQNPNTHLFNDVRFPRPPWLQDVFTRSVPLSTLVPALLDTATGKPSPGSINFQVGIQG